ncbi:MAG: 4-alpha-glucanotransferase [Pseudomonas sp.]
MIARSLKGLAEEVGLVYQWHDAHGQPLSLDEPVLREVLRALDLPADTAEQIKASLSEIRQRKHAAQQGPLIIADAGQPISLLNRSAPGSYCQLQREDGSQVELQLDHHGALPAQPCGYHRLSCGEQQWLLACTPPACQSVAELTGRHRLWGIAAQVYSLRRPGDAGLGDITALLQLAESAASQGADALAISPLHAMFNSRPTQYSPYSPSSRNHFNILHAAPSQVLGPDMVEQAMRECHLTEQARQLEQQSLIDWPAAAALRLRLLRQLHRQWVDAPGALHEDFQRFRREGGEQLRQHCCHEALQHSMLAQGYSDDWRQWPAAWRQPDSPAVRAFAEQQTAELEFHAFAQWLTERGLEQVHHGARKAGMSIGLIADMAIGADPSGSFGWACQAQLLGKVSIGAPPDLLNRQGQNWGVAAFSPLGLQQQGYSAFIRMLRANLEHSGGLRIDHIMGLQRLWIIPEGLSPEHGAYLNYPLDDLLRLLALESWRHRALIIGEDLGTVPCGLQTILAERHILGMRVLQFEQQDDLLAPPPGWSDQALATTSTHDLPTTLGWLSGRDIDWREQVGQCDAAQTRDDREQRQQAISTLDAALRKEGLLTEADNQQRLTASIRFLGRTPAPLVLLPLEDVMASTEQPNLPGSANDLHPNWRRRWPQPAAEMLDEPQVQQRLKALDEERRNPHGNVGDE